MVPVHRSKTLTKAEREGGGGGRGTRDGRRRKKEWMERGRKEGTEGKREGWKEAGEGDWPLFICSVDPLSLQLEQGCMCLWPLTSLATHALL